MAYRATSLGHGALPRGALFKQTMRGIQNFHADQTSTPKTAITTADLIAMYRLIDHTTFEGARDWCACALAFFGLLRINEYTNGGLQHGDVGFTAAGVMVTIRVSKTSLQPVHIDMAARTDFLCPALALAHYLAFFAQYPDLPQRPTNSLFITRRTVTEYHNTTDTEFISTVRSLMSRASPERDTSQYAGHSFRRGGTSAMKLAGVHDSVIQRHGRWRSDAYRNYIDVDHNIALRLIATQSIPTVAPDTLQPGPGRPLFCSLLASPRLVFSIGTPPSH